MSERGGVPEIGPSELKARLDVGDVPLLVDVREPFEIEIADLPDVGQARIPLGSFESRMSELDASREIVVYCRSGSRSARATAFLLAQGYPSVFNLRGGVLAWRNEVDPTLAAY